MTDDIFYTISQAVVYECRIKGSRFIARAEPVQTKEEAEQILAQQRRVYHDATHHCFAYRIGVGNEQLVRYTDAGEPSGTAGRPIFNAIQGRHLTNVIVVVTRYFGGVKLGTGGLARAYGETAAKALQQAVVRSGYLRQQYRLTFAYDLLNAVMHVLNQAKVEMVASHYGSDVVLKIAVRKSDSDIVQQRLRACCGGKIQIDPNP